MRTFPDPDAIFATIDWTGRSRVALAVSGGGDSMALLALFARWKRAPVSPIVLTVDHGLRAESAAEAAMVAAFCTARGIPHRTLAWDGATHTGNLSQAAREGRHRLLAEAARQGGADIVLTAHTFDDQAETVAMRSARGAGRGEAGMAPATLFEESVWFVRPLLDARREELRALLAATGVTWVEDPTNEDMHYERARTRKGLGEADRVAAVRRAGDRAAERERAGAAAATLIDEHATMAAAGLARLEAGFFEAAGGEAAYALRILLAVIGGRRHLVEAERAEALLAALRGADRLRMTLARCVVSRRGGTIYLHREARDLPTIETRATTIDWDGRYRIAFVGQEAGLLRVEPATLDDPPAPLMPVPPALVRAAYRAEPRLRFVADHRPALEEGAPDASVRYFALAMLGPWSHHLPSFDLEPAGAVARLLRGTAIPPSPLAGHILMP